MTTGPVNDVVRELRALISGSEQGSVSVEWSTAHGCRVVGLTEHDTPSGDAVATGDEPVDYVQVGGILPTPSASAAKPQDTRGEKAGHAIVKAFADSWRALFPAKEDHQ